MVRGDREGRVNLGCAGGTWATNNVENALIYGEQMSIVLKPKTVLQLEMDDAFAKYVAPGFGKEYSFADATDEEWAKLREGLLKDGYDALEITAPVGQDIQDFWILEQPGLLSVEEALSDLTKVVP